MATPEQNRLWHQYLSPTDPDDESQQIADEAVAEVEAAAEPPVLEAPEAPPEVAPEEAAEAPLALAGPPAGDRLPVTEGKPPKVAAVVAKPAPAPAPVTAKPSQPVTAPAPARAAYTPPTDKKAAELVTKTSDTQKSGAEGGGSKLADAGPSWYKDEAPPDENLWLQALLGLGSAGTLAALAPDAKSGIAAGLGSLLNTGAVMATSPQRDYDRRLDAAHKQSQMQKVLHDRGQGALEQSKFDLMVAKFDEDLRQTRNKEALSAALNNAGSAESKAAQDAAVESGWIKEAEARTKSAEQLKQMRVAMTQTLNREDTQQHRRNMFTAQVDQRMFETLMKRGWSVEDAAREVQNKMDTEERGRNVELAKANVPGWEFASGYAPSDHDVGKIREVVGARGRAVRAATELAGLQKKVALYRQAGGKLADIFGSDDQNRILARMKWLQGQLGSAQRVIFGQGAPQAFEMTLNATMNPEADDIMTFFTGPYAYEAAADVLGSEADAQLEDTYGMRRTTSAAAKPAPSSGGAAGRLSEAKDAVRDVGEKVAKTAKKVLPTDIVDKGKEIAGDVGEAVEELVTPPAAKPAAPSTAKGDAPGAKLTYNVTLPSGKVVQRDWTVEEAEAAEEKLGANPDGTPRVMRAQ